jgi:hypothetical protein
MYIEETKNAKKYVIMTIQLYKNVGLCNKECRKLRDVFIYLFADFVKAVSVIRIA